MRMMMFAAAFLVGSMLHGAAERCKRGAICEGDADSAFAAGMLDAQRQVKKARVAEIPAVTLEVFEDAEVKSADSVPKGARIRTLEEMRGDIELVNGNQGATLFEQVVLRLKHCEVPNCGISLHVARYGICYNLLAIDHPVFFQKVVVERLKGMGYRGLQLVHCKKLSGVHESVYGEVAYTTFALISNSRHRAWPKIPEARKHIIKRVECAQATRMQYAQLSAMLQEFWHKQGHMAIAGPVSNDGVSA